MSGQGARLRRFIKRNETVGPEMIIMYISLDRRYEFLECGHVLADMPHHPTSKHLVKVRRCPYHNMTKDHECSYCQGPHQSSDDHYFCFQCGIVYDDEHECPHQLEKEN